MITKKNPAQLYFDKADVIMIVVSNGEILIGINNKGIEILGYVEDEIVGKNWFDNFLPENVKEKIRLRFHEMLKGTLRHVHYEHPLITKKGEELVFNWHNILVSDDKGNTIGILSSGSDVTKRRLAEKIIKETEERLQITLDSMLEGCQIIDYDWRYVYVNEAVAKQARRSKKELIGYTMMEVYPGIEKTELFKHLKACMKERIPSEMENEFTFPDGSKGWFELRIEPAPAGVVVFSLDITKRKKIEEELNRYRQRLEVVVAERTAECAKANRQLKKEIEEHRKTEEGLMLRATILDNATEAIFLINSKGDFAYANKAASKTYGYSRDEFLNMNLKQLLQEKDRHLIDSHLKDVFRKGQLELEMTHQRKDKIIMQVQIRHNLITTLHGQFIVSVIRDITNEKKRKPS